MNARELHGIGGDQIRYANILSPGVEGEPVR